MHYEKQVLLTLYSLRADHCGFMGYERNTTPTLDELADDGIVYENALSVAPRTLPSAASFQTGEPLLRGDALASRTYVRRHLDRHPTISERRRSHEQEVLGIRAAGHTLNGV